MFGKAARDGELRRLGHAIVDHFGGREQPAFRSDEEDAAPIGGEHLREIVARETCAADHIDFKEVMPVRVADVGKILCLIDAEIVDEDIGGGNGGDQGGGAISRRGIGKDGVDGAADLRGGGVQLGLTTAGDGDGHSFVGQSFGDGETDAGSRTGDDGAFAQELQIHDDFL